LKAIDQFRIFKRDMAPMGRGLSSNAEPTTSEQAFAAVIDLHIGRLQFQIDDLKKRLEKHEAV